MKNYIGLKAIKARPMTLGAYNKYRGWKTPKDENPRYRGYLVEYADSESNHEKHKGFVSWFSKKIFDEAYKTSGEWSFSHALELLKNGYKLQRQDWPTSKGTFVFYVPSNEYEASGNKNNTLTGKYKNNMVPYQGYFAMKCSDGSVVPWTPTHSDLLNNDWQLY